jgi:hypothetical protein
MFIINPFLFPGAFSVLAAKKKPRAFSGFARGIDTYAENGGRPRLLPGPEPTNNNYCVFSSFCHDGVTIYRNIQAVKIKLIYFTEIRRKRGCNEYDLSKPSG